MMRGLSSYLHIVISRRTILDARRLDSMWVRVVIACLVPYAKNLRSRLFEPAEGRKQRVAGGHGGQRAWDGVPNRAPDMPLAGVFVAEGVARHPRVIRAHEGGA
jgi:hypothetical protein